MRILTLDPGTITGWATWFADEIASGTWDFKPRRGDGAGVRFLRLQAKLTEFEELLGVNRLVYELPAGRYLSGAADDCIKGLVSHIQSWCELHCVPCESVAPCELKKHATGKGNANKDAMAVAAKEKWPDQVFADSNEIDARWLLDYALSGRM